MKSEDSAGCKVDFSYFSFEPNMTHIPHIIVRLKTVAPTLVLTPVETWFWALSLLVKTPDAIIKKKIVLLVS